MYYDFHRGIEPLDAAHESDVGGEIAFCIVRIAEDHGVLGNDVEFAYAARQLERLFAGELLPHVAQGGVVAGFHAEEYHHAAGVAEFAQSVVGVAQHDIDARLAPPAQMERGDAFGQLACVVFAQEKVVVVELHRVDPILRLQVAQNGGGAGRRLHLLPVIHRDHAAEVAAEGAADTGLVDRRARAQEGACEVLGGVHAVVRQPGEIVRGFQRARGGVDVQAELVLEGQPADAGELARTPQFVEQFEQGLFALAFDHEIDIPGIERGLGIERCEIAAPGDGHARVFFAHRAAHRYGLE